MFVPVSSCVISEAILFDETLKERTFACVLTQNEAQTFWKQFVWTKEKLWAFVDSTDTDFGTMFRSTLGL